MKLPHLGFLLLHIFLGLAVLGAYAYCLPKVPNPWGALSSHRSVVYLYVVSIVLCTIGYLYWLFTTLYHTQTLEAYLWIGVVMFLIGAFGWPVGLYTHHAWLVVSSLWLTFLGAIVLFLGSILSCAVTGWISLLALGYLVFHTLVLDCVVWTWNYYLVGSPAS